ncbi:hypothetical protein AVEN_251098-1, partial [Araneus ventricosus]
VQLRIAELRGRSSPAVGEGKPSGAGAGVTPRRNRSLEETSTHAGASPFLLSAEGDEIVFISPFCSLSPREEERPIYFGIRLVALFL